MLMDFKIYGEGEWKVRQHGKQKKRRWKKFHIGVCPKTHEIIVAEVTKLEATDCEVGPKLLRKAPRSVKERLEMAHMIHGIVIGQHTIGDKN